MDSFIELIKVFDGKHLMFMIFCFSFLLPEVFGKKKVNKKKVLRGHSWSFQMVIS